MMLVHGNIRQFTINFSCTLMFFSCSTTQLQNNSIEGSKPQNPTYVDQGPSLEADLIPNLSKIEPVNNSLSPEVTDLNIRTEQSSVNSSENISMYDNSNQNITIIDQPNFLRTPQESYFFNLDTKPDLVSLPARIEDSPEIDPAGEYLVNISLLNVRSGPSMQSNIRYILKKNDLVKTIGKEGIWLRTYNNDYVSIHFLIPAPRTASLN